MKFFIVTSAAGGVLSMTKFKSLFVGNVLTSKSALSVGRKKVIANVK